MWRWDAVWQADDEDHSDDTDDEFFAIDEPTPESVTQESKRDLPNDVSQICSGIDAPPEEERIRR